MDKLRDRAIFLFAVLLGGAWIALYGYFFRYDISPLDVMNYADIVLFMIGFAVVLLLAAALVVVLAHFARLGIALLALLAAVATILLIDIYSGVVPLIAVGPEYAFQCWALLGLVAGMAVVIRMSARKLSLPYFSLLFLLVCGLIFGGGYLASLVKQAGFYAWQGGEPSGYKMYWSLSPYTACRCGAGIMWNGEHSVLLRCTGRNQIVHGGTPFVLRAKRPGAGDMLPPLKAYNPFYLAELDRKLSARCE